MTDLYLLDTYGISFQKNESLLNELDFSLPDCIREKIKKTSDESTKTDRILAYSFLIRILYEKGFSKEKIRESLSFGKHGKPFLKCSRENFSISHTSDMIAIAFGERDVGIDIEKINRSKEESVRKICNRYGGEVSFEISENIKNINKSYVLEPETEKQNKIIRFESVHQNNFATWTYIEALLKCDGGGFSSVKNIKQIQNSVICETVYVFEKNQEFVITVAEKKK